MTTKLEPLYILDTHTITWYLQNHKKLSLTARNILDSALESNTRLVASSIVVAELYYIYQKGLLKGDFKEIYENLKSFIEFVAVEADDILHFTRDAKVTEMHDRIIVGLARKLSAPSHYKG